MRIDILVEEVLTAVVVVVAVVAVVAVVVSSRNHNESRTVRGKDILD